MNRAQRRKFKKLEPIAEEIWKLEVLATLAKEDSVKESVEKDIARIASNCTLEELLWIDAYITEQYASRT